MKPLLRQTDGTCKRATDGVAENACNSECCSQCCAANCVLVQFVDWPALLIGGSVIDPLTFLNNGGNPFKLQRTRNCRFSYECAISTTIGGINYIHLSINAIVAVLNNGHVYIQELSGYLRPDTGNPADYIEIFGPIPWTQASAAGCDQVVTATPTDPITYPDAQMTVQFARGADCDDPDCDPGDSCATCCPDVTCAVLTLHLDITDTLSVTTGVDYTFPLIRGIPSDCWFYGACHVPETGAISYDAVAHIVCDDDGNPTLEYFAFSDRIRDVGAAIEEPMPIACGGSQSLTLTLFGFNPAVIASVSGSGTLEPSVECDDVENCDLPPHPGLCPEDCITCGEECGERCWVGSTLTLGSYSIETGECGICSSNETGDGCGHCCKCDVLCATAGACPTAPCTLGDPGCAACPCHIAADATACAVFAGDGYSWYCDPVCIANGDGSPGDTTSTCSRIDFSGTNLELAFSGIVGGNPHFGVTLTIGSDSVTFDIWFDCVALRWYARIVWNEHCIFEGDINGGCDTFSTIVLEGRDGDIADSDCVMLTGTLTDGSVDFANYTCPEAP